MGTPQEQIPAQSADPRSNEGADQQETHAVFVLQILLAFLIRLGHFDHGAGGLKLALGILGGFLAHTGKHLCTRRLNQGLGFHKA